MSFDFKKQIHVFITHVLSVCGLVLFAGLAQGQDNFSLGNPNSAPGPGTKDNTPSNFLDNESVSLFGDDVGSQDNKNPAKDGSGIGGGLTDDPAAESNTPKEPAPVNKVSPVQLEAKESPTAKSSVPAAMPQAPTSNIPVNSVQEISSGPAPAAINSQPLPSSVNTAQPQQTSTTNSSVQAPLVTDQSVAPIKKFDPLAPNEFSGAPPLPGSRKNLARGQAPEVYTVEPGDTLFDVCSQLIDDGNYWPRLWSLNPDIKNPHYIYPGTKIAFYPGDAESPPYLDVVEEDDMVPVDKGPLKEVELIAQRTEIPQLPKSNSNVSSDSESVEVIGPEGVPADEQIAQMFENGGSVYSDQRVVFKLPGFIFSNEREPLGEIEGGLKGERLAGEGVQVRINNAEKLAVGTTLTVLRERGEVVNPNSDEFVGYRYDFVGNLKVVDRFDEDVFVGLVTESFSGARPGDIVVPFLSTKRSVDNMAVTSLSSVVDATIVNMVEYGQKFGGEGTLVFVDRGGLSVGGSYPIFQKVVGGQMNEVGGTESKRKSIGMLKVIESSDKVTVAVIVQSSSEIKLGDKLIAR